MDDFDFALKLSNYTSLKRFIDLSLMNHKKLFHITTFSVQLPYIAAGHSLLCKHDYDRFTTVP